MRSDSIVYYDLAGITMSIQGDNDCAEALKHYFSTSKVDTVYEQPLLEVVVESNYKNIEIDEKFYSLSGKIAFNEYEYAVKKKNFVYAISNLYNPSEPVKLVIGCKRKRSFLNWCLAYIRPQNIGVCGRAEKFVDSIMTYEVFWYILAVLYMRQDKVFVHSGIASIGNEAYAMCGTGGCGKTSTLFSFLQRKNSKYIADDLGIIGTDCKTYYTPKKMAIYQSDAKYKNKDILQAISKLPFTLKFHWKLFQALGMTPRYRFNPYQVFDESRILREAELKEIIFLSRSNNAGVVKSEIDQNELATKIRHASFRELKELNEILNNIRAVGDESIRSHYPSIHDLEKEYENILMKIIKEVKSCQMAVPLKINPEEIIRQVVEN